MRQLRKFLVPLRMFFLGIFVLYALSINFFFHSHVINGVTIVHSHPYSANDDGEPIHSHTVAELQLIHQLSSFSVTSTIILAIILGVFLTLTLTIPIQTKPNYNSLSQKGIFRLRPPPLDALSH